MIVVSWNVRGTGSAEKRRAIRDVIVESACDIILIQESKMMAPSTSFFRSLGGSRVDVWCSLDAIGSAGGILIGWSSRKFSVINTIRLTHSLTVELHSRTWNKNVCITSVYGPCDDNQREAFFQELLTLHHSLAGPWLVGGDFNFTKGVEERRGNPQSRKDTLRFLDLISHLCLIDLDLKGRQFTWSNRRDSPSMARLDRFLFSVEWESIFPASVQRALSSSASDHVPIALICKERFSGSKLFRFESWWLKEPDFEDVVRSTWKSIDMGCNIAEAWVKNLRNVRAAIKYWAFERKIFNREVKKKILHDIEILDRKEELADLSTSELDARRILRASLEDLYKKEEIYWKQ